MKKRLLLIAAVLMFVGIPNVFADYSDGTEFELGIGLAPMNVEQEEGRVQKDDLLSNSLKTLHLGARWWHVFYATIDSFVLPPPIAEELSRPWIPIEGHPDGGEFGAGVFRPGLLSLLDVGLELKLWQLLFSAQIGVNNLYLLRQKELEDDSKEFNTSLGANIKLGLGFKFNDAFGVSAGVYSVQPSISDTTKVIMKMVSDNKKVQEAGVKQFMSTILYNLSVVLYL